MLFKLFGVLAAAYLVIVIVLWGTQERTALPGPLRPLPEPRSLGFADGQRVTVIAYDRTELHGWYLPPENGAGKQAPGLLWFYGNMETVGVLADVFEFLKPPGMGLLALDYRGYGENAGRASEVDLERDGEAALEFLQSRPEIDPSQVAVYGRSIGSTVAMHLASKHGVSAVILDSPMTTARDVATEHYWFFPRFLVTLDFDNLGRAAEIDAPLLVLHGDADRIIPTWMGQAVANAAPNGTFVPLAGAGHNTTYNVDPEAYRQVVWTHLGVDR
ncbi:MAG TPA: alpha/beta hydrolase [Rhodothermales bacterium]|nr:alpha/beta hydrolase [Rhodothermales bacterium]